MTKSNDQNVQSQLISAFALQQKNQVKEAMIIFEKILLDSPQNPDALHGLGMTYAQQHQFSQAIVYLERAIQVAPTIAEFHNNLGNAYKAVGKFRDAMRHYHEALRLKSPYAAAHNNLGTLLYRIGNYKEATHHFEKSIRIDPTSADTHYNLANCQIKQEKLLDALSHYQEVLKLRPEHLGALHNMGITLCALKHFEEALPLLTEVIKREPHNIDALFHLGIIHSALAKTHEAKTFYERVLKISPNHGNSHHNLATLYLQQKLPEKALEHYRLALNFQPQNKTAQHMIDALMGKTLKEGAPHEYTRALFDQYAYNYDEHVKMQLNYKVPALLRMLIAPYVSHPYPLVLDLGCGTGLCAPLFSDISLKLYGVDISPNMIEAARQRGGYHKLYVNDALTFLEENTLHFDLVLAADVFVYFGELHKIFIAIKHALNAASLFGFSIEVLEEMGKPDIAFQLRKTGRYAHKVTYIQELVEELGFKIEVSKKEIIRYQEESPVLGHLFLLRTP